MQFMQLSVIFGMLAVLALDDPVGPLLRGLSGDVVTVNAY